MRIRANEPQRLTGASARRLRGQAAVDSLCSRATVKPVPLIDARAPTLPQFTSGVPGGEGAAGVLAGLGEGGGAHKSEYSGWKVGMLVLA